VVKKPSFSRTKFIVFATRGVQLTNFVIKIIDNVQNMKLSFIVFLSFCLKGMHWKLSGQCIHLEFSHTCVQPETYFYRYNYNYRTFLTNKHNSLVILYPKRVNYL